MPSRQAQPLQKEPQIGQDVPWEDRQWYFNGSWLPAIDPALIGPDNYQTLENMRYVESGLEGVNGYTEINTTPISTYTNMRDGYQLRTGYTQSTYVLMRAIDSSGNARVYENRTAIGSQGDFESTHLHADASANLEAQFSEAPQASVAYLNGEESMIYSGDEYRFGGVFVCDGGGGDGNPIDYSESLSVNTSTDTADIGTSQTRIIVMSTRPLTGVKFYVENANGTASTFQPSYWTGAGWSAMGSWTDGTQSGGVSLAQTGLVSWDVDALSVDTNESPKHYEELYMYAYAFDLSAGDADLKYITVKPYFNNIKDVWDGVYRQPIQFQFDNNGAPEDYTLQVNESSDVNTPIGAQLGQLTYADDTVTIGFEEQMSGIRIVMLSNLTNSNEGQLTVKYWSGSAWVSVGASLTDGTATGSGTSAKSFAQSGLIYWKPPTAEVKQTLYGSQGYFYQFTWTDDAATNFSGTGADDVLVDIVTGIPAQLTVQPFKFPALYKNRLMLCNFEAGNEQNRIDYSVSNTPDAWNGIDSSNNGVLSLFFGGNTPITAATQLYNRFGSNVFAMFLVLKDSEVYVMLGDSSDDFEIYPVSFTLGCPAPHTLATAQVAFDRDRIQTRNVAIWLTYGGPVMFDGAMLSPMTGIENYFDPNENTYIDWDTITDARGWIDRTYNEYNLLVSTSGTGNDTWLVYDLLRRKWYKKDTGTALQPQCGFNLVSANGEQFNYGGVDDGTMIYLENGTNWNGTGITQRIKVGDFFPSENMWDETLIRKLKLISKKISSDSSKTLEVRYYADSSLSDGVGVTFADQSAGVTFVDQSAGVSFAGVPSSTLDLSLDIGSQRLTTVIDDMNRRALMHSFEFVITTDDVQKGFQPMMWGIRYRLERKDDQATD